MNNNIGEIRQITSKSSRAIYNENGKRITIKTHFRGFVQAVEELLNQKQENTYVKYKKEELELRVNGNLISIELDKDLTLNVYTMIEIFSEEDECSSTLEDLRVLKTSNENEVLNFLSDLLDYYNLNGRYPFLEVEEGFDGVQLVQDMYEAISNVTKEYHHIKDTELVEHLKNMGITHDNYCDEREVYFYNKNISHIRNNFYKEKEKRFRYEDEVNNTSEKRNSLKKSEQRLLKRFPSS